MAAWRTRRQIFYLIIFLAIISALVFGLFIFFKPVPTCFDGKQNQNEEGVDCGGTCAKACVVTSSPLRVLWTRVLPVDSGHYDVAVAIENKNADRGERAINYKIRIYGRDGSILTDRVGSTYANPLEKFMIFESGFATGKQEAVSADFNILAESPWLYSKPVPPVLNIERILEENNFTSTTSSPRLRFKVSNRSLNNLEKIEVTVLLKDENQNAYAGSRTLIDRLEKGQTKDIFFTWPRPLSQEPANVDFSWRLNGFEQMVELSR